MKERERYIWILAIVLAFTSPVWATNSQGDGRSFFNVNQTSSNEIGSGYDADGLGTPFNEDGTGFLHQEFPVGAITNSVYTDDGVFFEYGGLATTSDIPVVTTHHVVQAGLTGSDYGTLTGTINDSNRAFDTPTAYDPATIVVTLAGVTQAVCDTGCNVVATDSNTITFDSSMVPSSINGDYIIVEYDEP